MAKATTVADFVKHWGWVYVIYQMAEFYKESRDKQYDKGVIEFYNDLSFMKDHCKWQLEIAEQQMLANKYGN